MSPLSYRRVPEKPRGLHLSPIRILFLHSSNSPFSSLSLPSFSSSEPRSNCFFIFFLKDLATLNFFWVVSIFDRTLIKWPELPCFLISLKLVVTPPTVLLLGVLHPSQMLQLSFSLLILPLMKFFLFFLLKKLVKDKLFRGQFIGHSWLNWAFYLTNPLLLSFFVSRVQHLL